jgi:hypothetical protein
MKTNLIQAGSSKVDLSSITSEKLWEKSGRLSSVGSEVNLDQSDLIAWLMIVALSIQGPKGYWLSALTYTRRGSYHVSIELYQILQRFTRPRPSDM